VRSRGVCARVHGRSLMKLFDPVGSHVTRRTGPERRFVRRRKLSSTDPRRAGHE
jgi:hypothetical protein